jgi:hypothetical protein
LGSADYCINDERWVFMADVSQIFSIESFNKFSKRFKIESDDDENGFPSPNDSFEDKGTGGPAYGSDQDLQAELAKFYEKYGGQYFSFSFGNFSGAFYKGKKIFVDGHGMCSASSTNDVAKACQNDIESWNDNYHIPSNGDGLNAWTQSDIRNIYKLALNLTYGTKKDIKQFLKFLDKAKIVYPPFLQLIERIAKARGNVKLGRAIHKRFLKLKPQFKKLGIVKIGHKDYWGDDIYLDKKSAAYDAWKIAKKGLRNKSDIRAFAKAAAFFTQLEMHPETTIRSIRAVSKTIPELYKRGIPMPPVLFIQEIPPKGEGKNKIKMDGRHNANANTVILNPFIPSESRMQCVSIHEIGHSMHLMMDIGVIHYTAQRAGRGYKVPKLKDGTPVIERDRCDLLASVSGYGGTCNSEGHDKVAEDFAETFLFTMAKPLIADGVMDSSCLLVKTIEFTERNLLIILVNVGQLLNKQNLTDDDIKGINEGLAKVYAVYSSLAGITEQPVVVDKSDLKKAKEWYLNIAKSVYPESIARRDRKKKWMQAFLEYLAPKKGEPKRPSLVRLLSNFPNP